MDTSIISATSAVAGSICGGSATIAAAWFAHRAQSRGESARAELTKRETLYGEFISECSKLAIDSLVHGIENPEKIWLAYALLNRIRLSASGAVLAEAESAIRRITEQYFSPNISVDEMRSLTHSWEADPLKSFGEACRIELKTIRSGG